MRGLGMTTFAHQPDKILGSMGELLQRDRSRNPQVPLIVWTSLKMFPIAETSDGFCSKWTICDPTCSR